MHSARRRRFCWSKIIRFGSLFVLFLCVCGSLFSLPPLVLTIFPSSNPALVMGQVSVCSSICYGHRYRLDPLVPENPSHMVD
jgi:hypothetical protein